MPITPALLDELLKDYKSPDDMFVDDGLLQQLTKAVVERALQGEMTHWTFHQINGLPVFLRGSPKPRQDADQQPIY